MTLYFLDFFIFISCFINGEQCLFKEKKKKINLGKSDTNWLLCPSKDLAIAGTTIA